MHRSCYSNGSNSLHRRGVMTLVASDLRKDWSRPLSKGENGSLGG